MLLIVKTSRKQKRIHLIDISFYKQYLNKLSCVKKTLEKINYENLIKRAQRNFGNA